MVRIAVAGTRSRPATPEEARAFRRLWEYLGGTVLLHGACPDAGTRPTDGMPEGMRGIDAWAHERAMARGIPVEPYPPLQVSIGWPGCGPERNRRMVAAAEVVICFPGGAGTASTRGIALQFGRPLYRIVGGEWTGPEVGR